MKKELLELKDQIAEAKQKSAEAKGSLTFLSVQLKKDFGCDTLEEADVKLKNITASINKKEASLKKKVDKLKEDYEFNF